MTPLPKGSALAPGESGSLEMTETAGSQEKFELTVRTEVDAVTHVIQLFGELDQSSAALLEETLLRVEGTQAAQIVVDLSGLHFIDSAGCETLAEAATRSRSDGRRLGVLRGTGQVDRVLRVVRPCFDLPFLD
jgi:anti-anti-sigma factor